MPNSVMLSDNCSSRVSPVTRLNRQRCSRVCSRSRARNRNAFCHLSPVSVVDRDGLAFEEPVEDDLVAVLVGVGEVQHERRVGLEPPDVLGSAAARDDGEPRRHVAVEPRQVNVGLQQLGIPEQRKVVENDVVSA